MFSAYSTISDKKLSRKLSQGQLEGMVDGYVDGSVTDAHMAAFLMAVRLNGMDDDETLWLTEAMAKSGALIDTSPIACLMDKHSTGGVGDKTTFLVVSMLGALGYNAGLVSGRGLGHTGGTIDKLESINGFRSTYSPDEYVELLRCGHIAIVSQSQGIVPADGKMYDLRNDTATIDSIPLIASSIMSKKIASGSQNLVLDVKYGSGAFMKDESQARELAETMERIGRGHGMSVSSRLSSMDDVLGSAVGNACEIEECLRLMRGRRSTAELSADLVALGRPDAFSGREEVKAALLSTLSDGTALTAFLGLLGRQGCDVSGGADGLDMPSTEHSVAVPSPATGSVSAVDVERIGLAVAALGANRTVPGGDVFHDVGLRMLVHTGDEVKVCDPIALVVYGDDSRRRLLEEDFEHAISEVAAAHVIE